VGVNEGEKMMDSNLKYSLLTTVIVLSLIVAGAMTAAFN
jgi:hypothetical protein